MKFIQRYHNPPQLQKLHETKIYQKYQNHIEHLIEDTQKSFTSIQTPGWTSLVNTEHTRQSRMHQNPKNEQNHYHKQILSRLNSLPKLNNNQQFYSNIRIYPNAAKNKNVIVYGSIKEEEKKERQTPNSRKLLNKFNEKRLYKNLSLQKQQERNKKNSSRIRVTSVRSQPNGMLKDLIRQRLSVGNSRKLPKVTQFESKLTTQQNESQLNKFSSAGTFYSKIHTSNYKLKDHKNNQYTNKYLNKLHQRSKSNMTDRMFQRNKLGNQGLNKHLGVTNSQKKPSPLQAINRFNTITVHDHLYRDSIKLQSKKNIAKMIDLSYQKATILTFTPTILQKSKVLAEQKFSKLNNAQTFYPGIGHEKCLNKNICQIKKSQNFSSKNTMTVIKQQTITRQKQKMKDKLQSRTLVKLFYILSNNQTVLTNKTLEINIEKLPLSLIEMLQPLLTKIYQKKQYNLTYFLSLFLQSQNGKQESCVQRKKHVIVAMTEKYLRTMRESCKTQKENIPSNFGNLQIYEKQTFAVP